MNPKTSIQPPSLPSPAKIRQRRNQSIPGRGVGWGGSQSESGGIVEVWQWIQPEMKKIHEPFSHEIHFPWAISHEIHGILKRHMIGRWRSETGSPGQAFPLPPPQLTAVVNGQVWWDGVDEISCHKPVTSQGSGKVGSSSQPPPLAKELVFQGHVFCLIYRHKGTAFLVLLGQLRELIQAKYLV